MLRTSRRYALASWMLLSFGFAAAASAVTTAWSPVGDPGNACDPTSSGCFGAVGYAYSIGTYEVTNAHYAEFLNAKAASDPFNLYNPFMGSVASKGGIARSGSAGSYSYSAITGREDMPVNFVSFYDTLRFANWMNNGQGSGDTETGSYSMLGEAVPSNGPVTRNAGAWIVVPSEDEWYKAAYFNGVGAYFNFPAGSGVQTQCVTPTATGNRANCDGAVGDLTDVGSYPGSPSPYDTFDQGGNVLEWNEAIVGGARGIRGGAFNQAALQLFAEQRLWIAPTSETSDIGFRIAMIPEPGTALLLMIGMLGFACRRSAR